MTFINRAEVTNIPQILAIGAATPTTPAWGVLDGIAYQPGDNAMAVINAAPASTDPTIGGLRLTPDNRLYVWTVSTLGVPPIVVWNAGLPFTPDGRMVVSPNAAADSVAGWPVDASGWVCMSLSGAPPPPAPGAFTFVVNAGFSINIASLSWTASSDAVSYSIYRDGVFQASVLAPTAVYQQTLPIGAVYSYTMFAINTGGTTASASNPRSYSYQSIPGAVPGVPVATAGNTNALITWNAAPDGNSPITRYDINAYFTSTGFQAAPTQNGGTGTSYTFTGLVNGTSYFFDVHPINAVGPGPYSAPTNNVTPSAGATVPVAPTIGAASAPTSGQATVAFTPNGNGGSAILDYRITSTPGGIQATVAGSPGVITGLTNGQAYTFTVAARNAIGYSAESTASNSVTPPYTNVVPGAPTIGTAVAGAPGTGQATVSFTAPAPNGGQPPTSYTVTSSPGGITATGAASPIIVSGLQGGTPYTFTVTATNLTGTGPPSAASNSITLVTAPGAPLIGTATSPADGQISITFVAPNNGGSPITSYTATTSPGGFTATGAASPILITGLPSNTYTVTVTATNAVGTGPASAASNAVVVTAAVVPIFAASLQSTLVPQIATGSPTPTFTRSTTAYDTDWEGLLKQSVVSESRFVGARRVQNTLLSTQVLNAAAWTSESSNVSIAIGVTDPLGGTAAATVTATAASAIYQQNRGTGLVARASVWLRRRTGTGSITLYSPDLSTGTVVTLTGAWQRFASVIGPTGGNRLYVVFGTSGDAIDVAFPQVEPVVGQSNTNPGEYVSVGVLSAPFQGANVDGVQYFTTKNGNTVAGNVVTEATGAPITPANGGNALVCDASGPFGYLAEGARSNICLQSQTLATAPWAIVAMAAFGSGSTVDAIAAPDGTLTADLLRAAAGSAIHAIYQNVASSTNPTFSVYLKAGTSQFAAVSVDGGGSGTLWAVVVVNLTTGTITQTAEGTAGYLKGSSIVALPNGYYRVSVSSNTGGPSTATVKIQPVNAGTLTFESFANVTWNATGNETFYIWGGQVEEASFASSYIPTTTAFVTRNADNLTYQTSGNVLAAIGTFALEITASRVLEYTLWSLSYDSSLGTPYATNVTTTAIQMYDGTSTANGPVGTQGAFVKHAGSYGGGFMKAYANGVLGASGRPFDGSMNPGTAMRVGGLVSGTNEIFAQIRNYRQYNIVLTDAQIAAL